MQDVINAVGNGKSPFTSGFNIVKWMLGVMSIIFDIIFMIQHYILYRHSNSEDKEKKQMIEQVYISYYRKLD